MKILLKHLHWYAHGVEGSGDIRIAGGRITALGRGLIGTRDERVVNLPGYIAVPGLINAHDHLGLNLFPRRGNPPYANFYQWARDIYDPEEAMQKAIMSVSLRDRLFWGGYKNLVGGVTTVMHHDPFSRDVFGGHFPVDVLRRCAWSHSIGYGTHVASRARWARLRGRPFVLHAAEGTDADSMHEIDHLHMLGVLAPNTVLVHAIALGPKQVDLIADAGCAVVWCPSSNQFLYDASPPLPVLRRRGVPVALGTDSTLSGAPTLLDEIRAAHESGSAGAEELFEMVTTAAARIFRLTDGRGTLLEGGRADITVFPDASAIPSETLMRGDPSLVLVRGHVRLARRDIASRLGVAAVQAGTPIWLHGDVRGLRRRIAAIVGLEELEQNPLWRLPIFDYAAVLDDRPGRGGAHAARSDHHEPRSATTP